MKRVGKEGGKWIPPEKKEMLKSPVFFGLRESTSGQTKKFLNVPMSKGARK